MAYCGAIGSVNVLEFMSTDLFDESQENPFLLQTPLSMSPSKQQALHSDPTAQSSPQRRAFGAGALELPLHDPHECASPTPHTAQYYPQQQQQQYHMHSPPVSPISTPTSPSGRRASVTFDLPKSILKRESSYASDLSTAASDAEQPMPTDVGVTETELHKLLYSLARFSVASETSASSTTDYSPPRSRQHSMSQSPLSSMAPPEWLRRSGNSSDVPEYEYERGRSMQQCHSTGRAALKSRDNTAQRKTRRSKSVDRISYETDPDSDYDDDDVDDDDDDDGYDNTYDSTDDRRSAAARQRKSVTFETVKNLLRGGGIGRASRIVQRTVPDLRRKSMGTVSSRLKCRQKFARPTILTDAYHRVSTMKLGTKPMPAKIKHLAFPELFDPTAAEGEADPGMPSPKGQLRATSLVLLDTLDRIGTRAACPVHLLDDETPDYSNVQARVDSHNHIALRKRGLRRPSAWLMA